MASADTWDPPSISGGPAPAAFLTPVGAALPGLRVPLVQPSLTIGRDGSNGLCLPDDEMISRRHCVIHVLGSMVLIEDRSRNGTFVDGQRVHGLATLPVPSTILMGQTVLSVLPSENSTAEPSSDETISVDTYTGPGAASEARTEPEALLLVDMVESSSIAARDEPAYVELVLGMGRVLEHTLAQQHEPFLMCTGDGFCAAFSTASAAILAASALNVWASAQRNEAVRLVIALHWEAAKQPPSGDRAGSAIRVLSAVDRLRHEVPALRDALGALDDGAMVLMTDSLWGQLDDATQAQAQPVGHYQLAGLDTATAVYWLPTGA